RGAGTAPALPTACAGGAHHALDQRGGPDDDVHERAADLQFASGALLGQHVVQRPPGMAPNRCEGGCAGTDHRLHAIVRPRVRYERRARHVDGRWPDLCAGVPVVADNPEPPMAVDGALVAFLLRMGIPGQRTLLRRVHDLEPAPRARSVADAHRYPRNWRIDPRSSTLPASDR